jgi:hypothetical protein
LSLTLLFGIIQTQAMAKMNKAITTIKTDIELFVLDKSMP